MSYLDLHRNEIFKKYSTEELIKDFKSYRDGKGRLNKVLNHFFEELIFECKGPRGNLSPMEALQDDDLMKKILDYISIKPNFYTGNEVANVKSFFRNGGKWACKVANFCPKNAREIYLRYFSKDDNICILDTSAGFGARMSGSLGLNNNYCGIDPNKNLVLALEKYGRFLKDNELTTAKYRILCQGSETFNPMLENQFELSFTSPPYFNLEIYDNDNCESTKNYDNYELWLEKFAKPTIENTYKYLKVGGYAMINIKNLTRGKKEPLFDDWFKIFESINGFEFVEVFEMKHQSKKNYIMNTNYDASAYHGFKEPIMVFRKKF